MKIQKGELDNIDYWFIEYWNSNKTPFKYKLVHYNISVSIWSLIVLYINNNGKSEKPRVHVPTNNEIIFNKKVNNTKHQILR